MLLPAAATPEPVRLSALEERLPAVLLGGVHFHELDQRLWMSHHLRLLVGRFSRGHTGDRPEGDDHVAGIRRREGSMVKHPLMAAGNAYRTASRAICHQIGIGAHARELIHLTPPKTRPQDEPGTGWLPERVR
jgi:hypothetical protein